MSVLNKQRQNSNTSNSIIFSSLRHLCQVRALLEKTICKYSCLSSNQVVPSLSFQGTAAFSVEARIPGTGGKLMQLTGSCGFAAGPMVGLTASPLSMRAGAVESNTCGLYQGD